MPAPRLPRIVWGDSLEHTLDFAYPLDEATSWAEPRQVETVRFPSGEVSAWIPANDHFLSGKARWLVPTTGLGLGPTGTPWHGMAGVGAWLAWAQGKRAFRWYPDRVASPTVFLTCTLHEPVRGGVELEQDKTRVLSLVLRSTTEFTGY